MIQLNERPLTLFRAAKAAGPFSTITAISDD